MKKQLLLLTLISLCSLNTFAQTFTMSSAGATTITADELIEKMKCTSFDCYSSFMASKGFSFESTENKSGYTSYMFLSDERTSTNNPGITTKTTSIVFFYNDGTTGVGLRTSEIDQYKWLVQEFNYKQFVVSGESKSKRGGIRSQYKSVQYPGLNLTITVEQLSKNGIKWTSYDFEVSH